MQTRKVIEGLGYTPHEAKVYLAALELGECLATDVAQKAKLPLSSVQIILTALHRDGLINFYTRKHHKYWVPEDPARLLARLKLH